MSRLIGEEVHQQFMSDDGNGPQDPFDDETMSPAQHELLKDNLHGSDAYHRLKDTSRRYMVIGSNQGDRGERRIQVCSQLDLRPQAVAFRLEDFGLTRDEMHLWAAGFDLLAAMATHAIAVLEDFDGGHTWELGRLYPDRREILWLLRRVYKDPDQMRDRYDNSMAASHVEEMVEYNPDQVIEWRTPDELFDAIPEIP